MSVNTYNGTSLKRIAGNVQSASDLVYDNAESQLATSNTQGALDILAERQSNIIGSDAWHDGTAYNCGDMCIYQNALWQKIGTTERGVTPTEGASWTKLSLNDLGAFNVSKVVNCTLVADAIANPAINKCGKIVMGKVDTKNYATTEDWTVIGTLSDASDFPAQNSTAICLTPSYSNGNFLIVGADGNIYVRAKTSTHGVFGPATWYFSYITK